MPKFSEQELRERLTEEQFRVTQQKATEIPGTGALLRNKETGMYKCVVCGEELFDSNAKYDSQSGWPAFSEVVDSDKVILSEDRSHGMIRTEVTCANCGAHLGHVFPDNTSETGDWFCINSASLDFEPQKDREEFV